MKNFSVYIFIFFYLFSGKLFSQQENKYNENHLYIEWKLISNQYKNENQSLSSLHFINKGKTIFPPSGWSIYFNYNREISINSGSKDFTISHVNGDLFEIKPTSEFQGIKPNQKIELSFISEGQLLNYTAAPTSPYIVWNTNVSKGFTIINYHIKPIKDSKTSFVTPEEIYIKNIKTQNIPLENLPKIFPTPKFFESKKGQFILDKNVSIITESDFLNEAKYLSSELKTILNNSININSSNASKKIIFIKDKALKKEEYYLDIQTNKIEITASSGSGILYAIQSVKSLFPSHSWKLKTNSIALHNCVVKDAPRFELRGLMFDVARNFQSKETIYKILDLMALYKMNTFHFHFNDDEGWRLEIPSLPELTQVGSKRGHTLDSQSFLPTAYGSGPDINNYPGSGYYTKEDFIAILKYATERHIQVIPEIESPGHSRAAIKAMDSRYANYLQQGNTVEAEKYLLRDLNDESKHSSAQLWTDNIMCVALPSTYTFLEKVIDEILTMYEEANAPIETIHLGGDEVPAGTWEKSTICNQLISNDEQLNSTNDLWYYYFGKMNEILKKRNLFVSGWEEIAMRRTTLDGNKIYIPNPDFANQGFRANIWNNGIGWGSEDLPYKLANSGYKVILSCVSNLYFDLAYEKSADEIGYYWGGFNDLKKPFDFIPYDYYKNTTEDTNGNPIQSNLFNGKERLTDYGKSNIVGIQGQLFSENVRNTTILDYLLVPKLLALAERSWSQNPSWAIEKDLDKTIDLYIKDWSAFVNILGKKELPRLDYYHGGYNYRIPPVGAIIENGKVLANIQQPGFTIRYTTDGAEPKSNSTTYNYPIGAKARIKLCAFSSNGRKGKTTIIDNTIKDKIVKDK
jgi:hexosaminidase